MTDTTELWRDALGVMGYEVFILGGEELVRIGPKTYVSYSDWNLFGLAVEWIEARVANVGYVDVTCPCQNGSYGFSVWHPVFDNDKCVYAPTLPEAAARWIVEHGAKIKEGANG